MDIQNSLTLLANLTDDELSALESSIVDEFNSIDQDSQAPEDVKRMVDLADGMDLIIAEKSRRVSDAEQLAARASEAVTRMLANTAAVTEPVVEDDKDEDDEAGDPDIEGVDEDEDEDEDEDKKDPTVFSADSEPVQEPEDAAALSVENAEPGTLPEPTEAGDSAIPADNPAAEDATDDVESPEPAADADGEDPAPDLEENMTASADNSMIEAPAANTPKPTASPMSITAGADIPSISAGTKLDNMSTVAEAFTKRLHTLRHVTGGDGEQHIVASLHYDYPEERKLLGNDPLENQRRIEQVAGQQAITAAAGVCAPLETNYDMGCDVGVTDRPVRDALARFNADRGGIRFFTAPQLEDFGGATGWWNIDGTTTDYTGASISGNTKPCLEVACPEEQTAYVGAITLCLTFSNLTGRVWPELVARQNELALVQHARLAENKLLSQIEAGSTQVEVASTTFGAAREIMNLLARAAASYRHKHRIGATAPLRMLAPIWARELIRADIALQMPGDGLDDTLGLADAKIDAWFRSRNVNITWHLDGVGPSLTAGAVITGDNPATTEVETEYTGPSTGFSFPTNLEFALFAEGTWLYLDGGTMDLGLIRDSSLVASNQYKQFVETFENVVNIGCESYWVSAPFEATGAAAALVAG